MSTSTQTAGQTLQQRLTSSAGFALQNDSNGKVTLTKQTANRAAWEAGITAIWVSIDHEDGERVTVREFEGHLLESNSTTFQRATPANIQRIEWFIASLEE